MSLGIGGGVSAEMRKTVQDCVGGGRRRATATGSAAEGVVTPLACVGRGGINALILAREDGRGSRSGDDRLMVQTGNTVYL